MFKKIATALMPTILNGVQNHIQKRNFRKQLEVEKIGALTDLAEQESLQYQQLEQAYLEQKTIIEQDQAKIQALLSEMTIAYQQEIKTLSEKQEKENNSIQNTMKQQFVQIQYIREACQCFKNGDPSLLKATYHNNKNFSSNLYKMIASIFINTQNQKQYTIDPLRVLQLETKLTQYENTLKARTDGVVAHIKEVVSRRVDIRHQQFMMQQEKLKTQLSMVSLEDKKLVEAYHEACRQVLIKVRAEQQRINLRARKLYDDFSRQQLPLIPLDFYRSQRFALEGMPTEIVMTNDIYFLPTFEQQKDALRRLSSIDLVNETHKQTPIPAIAHTLLP